MKHESFFSVDSFWLHYLWHKLWKQTLEKYWNGANWCLQYIIESHNKSPRSWLFNFSDTVNGVHLCLKILERSCKLSQDVWNQSWSFPNSCGKNIVYATQTCGCSKCGLLTPPGTSHTRSVIYVTNTISRVLQLLYVWELQCEFEAMLLAMMLWWSQALNLCVGYLGIWIWLRVASRFFTFLISVMLVFHLFMHPEIFCCCLT